MKEIKWSAQILLNSNRLTKVEFLCHSNLREDAEQKCNCLLYTSPSPRDRTRSRMPSSA